MILNYKLDQSDMWKMKNKFITHHLPVANPGFSSVCVVEMADVDVGNFNLCFR